MAVKDIRSNLKQTLAQLATIGDTTPVNGAVIDTADFELGLMFSLFLTAHNAGDFTLSIFEDDVVTFDNDPTEITDENQLIGDLPVATAASVAGDDLPTVGVISNKRFVRTTLTGSNTPSGTNTAVVLVTQKGENLPITDNT